MTPPKQPKKRNYQQHGLHAVSKALASVGDMGGWLAAQGEVGAAAKAMREKLITEQRGKRKTVSEMELMVIDGAIKLHIMVQSTGCYINEMPCPVNKVKRQLFPVVPQWQTMFEGLRSTAKDLNELRLKHPPEEPVTLHASL